MVNLITSQNSYENRVINVLLFFILNPKHEMSCKFQFKNKKF
jgi:hypothetical protein